MNNILDLSSSFDFNNNNVIKGEIEIDDVFELENNIEILVQDKIVEPTREIQTVTVDEDYDQLGTVTVNPIPDEYIIPDGTLDVDANGDVDVTMFRMARVGVYTPPALQDKVVMPTREEQIIRYDEDYDGLNSVIVNSIPDEYIIPTGTLNINKNGTQNVNNYDNVKVKVKSVANIGPKHLYLIKDGVEQTDITGGSAFLDMGLGTGYTSISQGNGYLGLCVAEATRSFTFANSFDYNKYTKLCVEWAYPKADNYGNYIAPTIGVKISKQPSDDSMVKTFLMHGGNTRETKPKTITELDIVDAVEDSKVNIIIGRTGYGSDFPSYPAHIYNLYLESSAINLQDKSIEVVQNGTQIITPDTDYDGLNSVTVNTSAIEDLTKELTAQSEEIAQQENQLQDIVEFLENKVEGEEGMGMRILKCDTNGYPAELEIYGFEKIPNYYLDNNSQSNPTYRAFFRMTKLIIKEGIKEIGSYAFRNNSSLVGSCETILPDSLEVIGTCAFNKSRMDIKKLPPNLISIGQSAFEYSQVSFKQIPDGVTKIPRATLSQAYNITQLSMRNVSNLDAISNGLCAFGGADNLKAVWMGSKVTNATLTQYAFNISNIRYVPKVFIDLPRATVESFTYYNCGFSTISNQDNEAAKNRIVCNDDKEWLTKEEFDAINWSTYVEEV